MTTIKVDSAVRDRLVGIARARGITTGALLDQESRRLEVEQHWSEIEAAHRRLQYDDPPRWGDYITELAEVTACEPDTSAAEEWPEYDGCRLHQGQIWLATLDHTVADEQRGLRPCLVISADRFSALAIRQAIVVPLTNRERGLPHHVRVVDDGRLNAASSAIREALRAVFNATLRTSDQHAHRRHRRQSHRAVDPMAHPLQQKYRLGIRRSPTETNPAPIARERGGGAPVARPGGRRYRRPGRPLCGRGGRFGGDGGD